MKDIIISSMHGDRPANRLIATGCVLMFVPFVLALVWLVVAVSPALGAYRSRTAQPIPIAGPGQGLIIVAEFDGPTEIDDQLDRSVTNTVYSSYNSTIYTGRSGRTIRSHEEALALGDEYGAGVVVWGTSDGTSAEVTISFTFPIDQDEPDRISLTLPEGDPGGLTFVGGFLRALLELHANPPSYGGWNATYSLEPVLATGDLQPVPVHWVTYYYSMTQLLNGQPGLAESAIENALDNSPPDSPIWPLYARLLIQSGRTTDALNLIEGLPHQSSAALRDLYLDLLIRVGRFDEAAAEIEERLVASPGNRDLLLSYAALLERSGDPAGAADVYSDLIEMAPDDVFLWLERARLYQSTGNTETAIADLNRIAEASAADVPAGLRLVLMQTRADLLLESGDAQAALSAYQDLEATFPQSLDAQIGIGLAYWLMENEPKARETWEAAGWNFSNSSGIRIVALELARRGYPEPAAEVLQTALDMAGSDPEETYVRAVIAAQAGDYDEAYRLFGEADGAMSYVDTAFSPTFVREWADAALASGRTEIALALYQRYLLERPDAPDAGEVRAFLEGQ